jgi:hypothetical protein
MLIFCWFSGLVFLERKVVSGENPPKKKTIKEQFLLEW